MKNDKSNFIEEKQGGCLIQEHNGCKVVNEYLKLLTQQNKLNSNFITSPKMTRPRRKKIQQYIRKSQQ